MTAPGGVIGSAFIDIIARVGGFAPQLRRDLTPAQREAERQGRQAGDGYGREFGDQVEKQAKDSNNGLLTAAAATGAGLAAAFGGSLASALDQQGVNAKLTAQLDLTPAQSAQAGKVAGDLFTSNYGDSLGEVSAAVRSVAQDIGVGVGSVDLQPITGQVLSLAGTFDQDLGGVTRAVGQLLKTGLAPDAQSALDIVAGGFVKGADKSGDFLDTLNEYGTQFRKLGIDGGTATNLISQGLQAGARDGDLVADSIKEFSIRAVDGSQTTSDAFTGLGLDARALSEQIAAGGPAASAGLDTVLDKLRAVRDPAQQAAIATGLFGSQAEDLGGALFALDPSTAAAGLDEFAGAAGRVDSTVGATAAGSLESFKRQVSQTFVDFVGGRALPAVTSLAHVLAADLGPAITGAGVVLGPLAGQAQDFISAIPTPVLVTVAGAVGLIAAALAADAAVTAAASGATAAYTAVKAIFVTTTSAETGAVTLSLIARGQVAAATVIHTAAVVAGTVASGAAAIATGALNVVLSLNPFVAVAIAAGVLVAGLIVLYQKSETVRGIVGAMGDAFGAFKDAALDVLRVVVDTFLGFAETLVQGAAKAFGWVPGIGGKLKGAAADIAQFRDDTNAALGGIADQDISIVARTSILAQENEPGFSGTVRRAMGGAIYGPGTGTSDSVPFWGSHGEHVVTAEEVRGAGGHDAIMAARRAWRGYATGGPVGGDPGLTVRAGQEFRDRALRVTPEGFDPDLIARGAQAFADATAKAITTTAQAQADKAAQAGGGGGQVADTLRRFLGTPYSWGGGTINGPSRGFAQGASTVGWDCSSFMQFGFWQALHQLIPRTARTQQAAASGSGAVPGALAFFGRPAHHVALLTGGGRMIEEPHTGAFAREVGARAATSYGVFPRALGGDVTRGTAYLVGEAGAEIIIPRQDGTVLPADLSRQIGASLTSNTATAVAGDSNGLLRELRENNRLLAAQLSALQQAPAATGLALGQTLGVVAGQAVHDRRTRR